MNKLTLHTLAALCSGLLWLGAPAAQAAVLNFDDIDFAGDSSAGAPSALNYGGFNWDPKWSVGSTDKDGFGNTAQSGSQFLFNEGATRRLTISRDSAFDFLGAWFSAPAQWPSRFIRIEAFDAADESLGTTGYLDDDYEAGPILIEADFSSVSRLEIDPFGATFTMDSFSFRDPIVSLSEAGGLVLLGIGIFGLWAARRRLPGGGQ